MKRSDLISRIIKRKQQINITIENLAKFSELGTRTLNRFFSGADIKLSTVEKVTNILGLDFAGNEIVSIKELNKQRSYEKAIFMASLVQSTSALEMQGLEQTNLENIIKTFQQEFLNGNYRDRLWIA